MMRRLLDPSSSYGIPVELCIVATWQCIEEKGFAGPLAPVYLPVAVVGFRESICRWDLTSDKAVG